MSAEDSRPIIRDLSLNLKIDKGGEKIHISVSDGFMDVKPEEILRLSYLMSVPVVLASNFYLLLQDPVLPWKEGTVALLFSFGVGLLSLSLLLKLVKKINFFKFALTFGLVCLAGAAIGFLL